MSITAPERSLDAVLAGVAVSSTLDPRIAADEVVDRLLDLAAGNRTAVARACAGWRAPAGRPTSSASRSRATWAW